MKRKLLNLFLIKLFFLFLLNTSFAKENICFDGKMYIENNKFYLIESKKLFHGKNKCYFKSGNLRVEQTFIEGVKNGIEENWYDQKGSLKRKTIYVNGKRQGIDQTWYLDGSIKNIRSWLDDQMYGRLFNFFSKW